jgi:hypothetical protein
MTIGRMLKDAAPSAHRGQRSGEATVVVAELVLMRHAYPV